MAKVEVEDRAWSESRFRTAARAIRSGASEMRGCMLDIWHGSQQLGFEYVTEEEIGDWLELRPRLRAADVIGALASVGLLEPIDHNDVPSLHARDVFATSSRCFRVDGNAIRVMKTQVRIAKAKEAAFARWGTAPVKGSSDSEECADCMLGACSKHSSEECSKHVPSNARHKDRETERQKNRTEPPKAPQGGRGGKISGRARSHLAAAIVEKTIGACNSAEPNWTDAECERAARAFIGEDGYQLVTMRHRGSWLRFREWISRRIEKVPLAIVEKDMRRTIAGLLADRPDFNAGASQPTFGHADTADD